MMQTWVLPYCTAPSEPGPGLRAPREDCPGDMPSQSVTPGGAWCPWSFLRVAETCFTPNVSSWCVFFRKSLDEGLSIAAGPGHTRGLFWRTDNF